jgi:hypothetical protein
MVSANIFVRKDNPDIKKITTTAPMISYCLVKQFIFKYSYTIYILPHFIDHSARI